MGSLWTNPASLACWFMSASPPEADVELEYCYLSRWARNGVDALGNVGVRPRHHIKLRAFELCLAHQSVAPVNPWTIAPGATHRSTLCSLRLWQRYGIPSICVNKTS
jgi:hypothetical protein